MAAKTFTTWADLYQDMLNALADFAANRAQLAEYEINTGGATRRFKYRSFKELQDGIAFVKSMADAEGASPTAHGRTYAKAGGGRW